MDHWSEIGVLVACSVFTAIPRGIHSELILDAADF